MEGGERESANEEMGLEQLQLPERVIDVRAEEQSLAAREWLSEAALFFFCLVTDQSCGRLRSGAEELGGSVACVEGWLLTSGLMDFRIAGSTRSDGNEDRRRVENLYI